MEKQPILILYSDGTLELPGAQTWGHVRTRFETIAKLAIEFERHMLNMPLQTEQVERKNETIN